MAIIQISKIQQRSGNLVDLPQLDEAQFGWATDAKRLFIGKTSPNENIEVLTSYSNISFSQIDGSDGGNFNIANATNGQVLTYVSTTNTWENWPSTDILTANANFKLDLGDVGNIKMDGGATGYILETDTTRTDYPVDEQGFPSMVNASDSYYFQIGAGWFESTPVHRSSEIINYTTSVFTGQNFNVQTELSPFTYGYPYLQRYMDFPYLNFGFGLQKINDNKKSWVSTDTTRINSDAGFNSDYYVGDDRLILNVKNVDLYLNPAQGLLYDVWYVSQTSNFPIPNTGLPDFSSENYLNGFNLGNCNYTAGTSVNGLVYCGFQFDRTVINPKPQKKTFFEFAQDFIKNMINVRDRLFITDGKTGGYPKLQSIFWQYLLLGRYRLDISHKIL